MTKKQILTIIKLDYLNKSVKNFERNFVFPCRKIDQIGAIHRYAIEFDEDKRPIVVNLMVQDNKIINII